MGAVELKEAWREVEAWHGMAELESRRGRGVGAASQDSRDAISHREEQQMWRRAGP